MSVGGDQSIDHLGDRANDWSPEQVAHGVQATAAAVPKHLRHCRSSTVGVAPRADPQHRSPYLRDSHAQRAKVGVLPRQHGDADREAVHDDPRATRTETAVAVVEKSWFSGGHTLHLPIRERDATSDQGQTNGVRRSPHRPR